MSRYGKTKEEIKNIYKVDVDKVHFEDRGNYKISPVVPRRKRLLHKIELIETKLNWFMILSI